MLPGSIVGDATNKAVKGVQTSANDINKSISNAQTRTNYVTGRNASGTDSWSGGSTWVGEEGPELVSLPRGSSITPAGEVGENVINYNYITIDAKSVKDFNDVVNLFSNQRMALRRT